DGRRGISGRGRGRLGRVGEPGRDNDELGPEGRREQRRTEQPPRVPFRKPTHVLPLDLSAPAGTGEFASVSPLAPHRPGDQVAACGSTLRPSKAKVSI